MTIRRGTCATSTSARIRNRSALGLACLALSLAAVPGRSQSLGPGLVFNAVQPCRLIDTRAGRGFSGSYGPPNLLHHTPPTGPTGAQIRTFVVASDTASDFAGQPAPCHVPSTAKAVALGVSAGTIPGSSQGFITLYPTALAPAVGATVVFTTGVNIETAALVPLGAGGNFDVIAGYSDIGLVVDLTGYFTEAHVPTLFGQFGGSGADGDKHYTTNDLLPAVARFRTLTIDTGVTVNTSTFVTSIAVQGVCAIHGLIRSATGALGSMFPDPGIPGDINPNFVPNTVRSSRFCATGAGGAGGAGSDGGYAAGVGGNALFNLGNGAAGPGFFMPAITGLFTSGAGSTNDSFSLLLGCVGAGGGGAGAPDLTTGGRGGGVIYLECGSLDFTGSIDASGVPGSPGISANGSGSGGGGGGVALIRTRKILANTGAISAAGGLGGVGVGSGSHGGRGGDGVWDLVVVQ